MVHVRVGEHDGIHLRGQGRQIPVDLVRLRASALVEAAIKEDAAAIHLQLVQRSGYGLGGAAEGKSHRLYSITSLSRSATGIQRRVANFPGIPPFCRDRNFR